MGRSFREGSLLGLWKWKKSLGGGVEQGRRTSDCEEEGGFFVLGKRKGSGLEKAKEGDSKQGSKKWVVKQGGTNSQSDH